MTTNAQHTSLDRFYDTLPAPDAVSRKARLRVA